MVSDDVLACNAWATKYVLLQLLNRFLCREYSKKAVVLSPSPALTKFRAMTVHGSHGSRGAHKKAAASKKAEHRLLFYVERDRVSAQLRAAGGDADGVGVRSAA